MERPIASWITSIIRNITILPSSKYKAYIMHFGKYFVKYVKCLRNIIIATNRIFESERKT